MGKFLWKLNLHYKEIEDGIGQSKWKEIKDDNDASEVSSYAELKKCEVHFYVEHSLNEAIVTEVPKQLPYDKDDDGVTGRVGEMENVAGVAENDGIRENIAGVVENEGVAEQVDTRGKWVAENDTVQEEDPNSSDESLNNLHFDDRDQGGEVIVAETYMPENVDRMYGMEEEYLSEEMESCDESDCDKNARPRVGRSTTYRVKTLIGRHTYGRVFDNNNAKAGWVAKAVVNGLKSNSKGRPRLATGASTSNTTNGSRQKRGNVVPKKSSQTKNKGKGKETNSQPQENTSQYAINPEEVVKSLYGVMLACGEATGAKDAFNAAFKNAGITEDQIGSVQHSPVAFSFETAATTLRRIQESVSEGSLNIGATQRHASDLLQTLSHTVGLTIQGAEMEQSVNALSQSAAILRGDQNDGGEDIQGGQTPESSAYRSKKNRTLGPLFLQDELFVTWLKWGIFW
ncbi:hypothetical protein SESBI_06002 [Sesbania bispinosa]|nr:hypothetical protein SESBI_06002 [Sesbania bispinosa]